MKNSKPMTVRSLIAFLQEQPPTRKVLVDGYEAGYNRLLLTNCSTLRVKVVSHRWWCGGYEVALDKERGEKCVVLGR